MIVTCDHRVSTVIRLDSALINPMSDLLKQAPWEHVIFLLLILAPNAMDERSQMPPPLICLP